MSAETASTEGSRKDHVSLDLVIESHLERKNFLFLGFDHGGDRAAAIDTILESAKLNHLDPEAYLAHVLDRLAHGPMNRLDELLPWNYKPPPATAT